MMLKRGDTGAYVRGLKNGLAVLGFLSYAEVNQHYDWNTCQSVREFQEAEGLEETGKVDDETWRALNKRVAALTS